MQILSLQKIGYMNLIKGLFPWLLMRNHQIFLISVILPIFALIRNYILTRA